MHHGRVTKPQRGDIFLAVKLEDIIVYAWENIYFFVIKLYAA
jgi:hypothetical protein